MIITEINWREEFNKLQEYCISLEHTRADLMGNNEELREKIKSLELGQEELLTKIRRIEMKKILDSYSPGNFLPDSPWQAPPVDML